MKREETKKNPIRSDLSWDMEADVVVIGSGAAGLVAAIVAIDSGASVIVVEVAPYFLSSVPQGLVSRIGRT